MKRTSRQADAWVSALDPGQANGYSEGDCAPSLEADVVVMTDDEVSQANEASRESEARLRSISEVLPDLVFLVDEDGCIAEILNSKSELLYQEASSLQGRLLSEIFPEREAQVFMGLVRDTISTEKAQVLEYSLAVPAGRRWFEGRTSLYPLSLRGKRAVVFLARDIGDRRRTETAVRMIVESSSRQYGHAFFESLANDLAATLEAEYTLIGELQKGVVDSIQTIAVSADGELAPNFKYELAGTPCANVIDQNVCSYKSDVAELFPEDTLLTEMGVQGYVGVPLFDSEGLPLGVMAALYRSPLEETGFAESILQVFSARAGGEMQRLKVEQALRLRDHQYHTMLHSSMDGFLVVDAESWQLLDVNEAFCQMNGYVRQELLGMPVTDLAATEAREGLPRDLRKLGNAGNVHFETLLRRKDGVLIDVEVSTTSLADHGGHYYVFARDISERKRTDRELRKRVDELVEERTADIEQAGNVLKDYSARVVRAQEDERARISRELHDDSLQSLIQVSRDLEALTEDSFARDETAATALRELRMQLRQSVHSLRGLAAGLRPPMFDELGLPAALEELVSRVSDSAGVEIMLDANADASPTGNDEDLALYRIVQEALSNVVQHSGASRASVTLRQGPEGTQLLVCDGGAGFVTAGRGGSDHRAHLGLIGMSERARNLGGSMRVRSILGLGTAIRVVILHPPQGPSLRDAPADDGR